MKSFIYTDRLLYIEAPEKFNFDMQFLEDEKEVRSSPSTGNKKWYSG
jgi:hypothetical protein